ncbi:MAG TPA: hypothetical protein VNZ44_19440 [Pyrinomonadaceae bacterium]|nr:hypothetical protein [Pyrinomonadaceae bacterium]
MIEGSEGQSSNESTRRRGAGGDVQSRGVGSDADSPERTGAESQPGGDIPPKAGENQQQKA